jgi:2-succinyl-5-enolpyruvyl-6-hydroxy-3-cyclohexene-1-carboxylate synthase
MKLSVNRNIIWSDLFVQRLADLGVRYACISPGSRSTSLTLAFCSNKKIKTFSIVDERSSAFFALGLAKRTQTPVAVITTSGTAVAELYPAIIEAYYRRIPLIICTADRPSALYNKGANQTINQRNIYKNHIRFFADAGLPDPNKLGYIKQLAEDAIRTSVLENKGPVHINLPFEKPFEPKSYTDKVEVKKLEKFFSSSSFVIHPKKQDKIDFVSLAGRFAKTERGLIIASVNTYNKEFPALLSKFSELFGYPVYIDGSSSLRFGNKKHINVIDNLSAIARAKNFQKYFDPKLIIQFGSTPTANVLLDFFKNSKAEKILVNEFGDRNDPSLTAKTVLKIDPAEFCESVFKASKNFTNRDSCWLIDYNVMNNLAAKLKDKLINKSSFPFEGRIAAEVISALPENSNLMISNSLPIRDVDFFVSAKAKKIHVYTNRGASGIDGINSTALGIAAASKEPTYLLIGDLAFFHDLNGIYNALKHKINLKIILINNSGGGIFESLPIAQYRQFFNENFFTPLELDFSKLVKAYGFSFVRIKSWQALKQKLGRSGGSKNLSVLEINTDAKMSRLLREKYWSSVAYKINSYIDEINS